MRKNMELPIALLEAMSYNLDVLVSDIPANKEMQLSVNYFFKTGDINDLTNKLKEKIIHLQPSVTYNMNTYNWDTISLQVLDVYKKLKTKLSIPGD
jgi:glycosyltransferase involved in cell wall biosynthesis